MTCPNTAYTEETTKKCKLKCTLATNKLVTRSECIDGPCTHIESYFANGTFACSTKLMEDQSSVPTVNQPYKPLTSLIDQATSQSGQTDVII